MSQKYQHVLAPLKINNVVLKNRMSFPVAPVHFLQGPETFPAESFMTFYADLAKNGAAYIDLGEWNDKNQRTVGADDSRRMNFFDTDDPSVDNYLSQLADDVHFYGSKLCLMTGSGDFPDGYSFNGGLMRKGSPTAPLLPTEMMPAERMGEVMQGVIDKLKKYKGLGYDMCTIRLLDYAFPSSNTRTDEYGGSLENRLRYPLELCARIKSELGRDFLIECICAGECDDYTAEELGDIACRFDGLVDIWTLRERDIAACHPTGFTFTPGDHPVIGYARRMRSRGVKAAIGVNGGFQDLDEMEGYLANGDCDLISMGRAFFADFEYYQKAIEGRGEDVRPCLWCNKCHGVLKAPWLTFCSVNAKMGNAHKLGRMVSDEVTPRRVAVIGGGVAGMEAALQAAQLGHEVTLYEKTDHLGGQLIHAEYFSFKWPLDRFKRWQERQLRKLGVNIILNHEPDAAEIVGGDYYAVIAATGAEPNIPNISGLKNPDGSRVEGFWTCLETVGHEAELGHRVVIVGGSETGIETAMYLGEHGHKLTVLTRQGQIASDAPQLHYITMSWLNKEHPGKGLFGTNAEWEKPKYGGIDEITEAQTVAVTPTSVTYRNAEGEHTLECDSVVICGGMNPRQDAALKYAGLTPKFFMAGDCEKVGNIRECTRSAYARASQI